MGLWPYFRSVFPRFSKKYTHTHIYHKKQNCTCQAISWCFKFFIVAFSFLRCLNTHLKILLLISTFRHKYNATSLPYLPSLRHSRTVSHYFIFFFLSFLWFMIFLLQIILCDWSPERERERERERDWDWKLVSIQMHWRRYQKIILCLI